MRVTAVTHFLLKDEVLKQQFVQKYCKIEQFVLEIYSKSQSLDSAPSSESYALILRAF